MVQIAERKVGVGEEPIVYFNILGCVHAGATYILGKADSKIPLGMIA